MAITLLQAPDKFAPVYNPMVFLFSSTNTAQTNFKFVFDIYDGAGTTLILRIKQSARPTDGYGLIDIHRVLENYVNSSGYDLTFATAFTKNTNAYKSYLLKVGEEYGSTPAITANLYTGTKKYAYNAYFDSLDFVSYTQTPYVIAGGGSRVFLTNGRPSQIKMAEKAWLYLMTDTANAAAELEIVAYDSSGSILALTRVDNTYKGLADDDSRFLRVPSGPTNLNLVSSGSITLGAQPIIPSTAAYYTLQLLNAGGPPLYTSEAYRYNINSDCNTYTEYRLHFLNKLGGFDSFTFSKASETVYDGIERQTYKKIAGTVSGATWAVSASDRHEIAYNTSAKQRIRLSSNWITETESTWLKELVMSPVVFYETGTSLIPVNVSDSSYVLKQKINQPLFNLELNISYTFDINSQRG